MKTYIFYIKILVLCAVGQSVHAEWEKDVQINFISHLSNGTIQINLMNTIKCGNIVNQKYIHIIPNDVGNALETMHRGLLSGFLAGRTMDFETGVSWSRSDLCGLKRVLIK